MFCIEFGLEAPRNVSTDITYKKIAKGFLMHTDSFIYIVIKNPASQHARQTLKSAHLHLQDSDDHDVQNLIY